MTFDPGNRLSGLRRRFAQETSGTIAILFALSVLPVFVSIGLAIDGARGYSTKSKFGAVLDGAALATAKTMRDRDLADEEALAMADRFVRLHMQRDLANSITTDDVTIVVDRAANTIKVDATAFVANHFGSMVNMPRFEVSQSATASFAVKEVELGMMLDVSGSMGEFGKIGDLQTAVGSLLDTLFPDNGSRFKSRVGIAPFSTSVNVGAYAAIAKGTGLGSGCVTERTGSSAFSDAPPMNGFKFGSAATECPVNSILPLTDRKTDLSSAVSALSPNGATAGHLGAAWAWYLVSPSWSSIWPAASTPKPYGDPKVVKAVLLMTDGMFNTEYEAGLNGTSAAQAASLCQNIKAQGVTVYTVAFQAPTEVLPVLRNCATTPAHAYDARDASALNTAFSKIASELMELRITR